MANGSNEASTQASHTLLVPRGSILQLRLGEGIEAKASTCHGSVARDERRPRRPGWSRPCRHRRLRCGAGFRLPSTPRDLQAPDLQRACRPGPHAALVAAEVRLPEFPATAAYS